MATDRKSSSLLEIDDNIIRQQLVLEGGDVPKELETLFPQPSPFERAATIKPKPGVCLKTRDKDKNKVFVNICTSESIPSPEDITDEELIAILESDKPSDFRVPMSIGPPHEEKDKSGEECVAYDIIISPQFFSKMIDNALFHNFFIITTLEGLDSKYSLDLDKNGWTVLKNKKYHGDMPEQTVRTTMPLVQELSGVRHWKPEDVTSATKASASPVIPSATKPLITEISTKPVSDSAEKKEKQQPKFTLKRLSSDKKTADTLEAEVELRDVVSGRRVDVNVGEDRLVVETPSSLLDVFVPFSLDCEKAEAYFITSNRVLSIMAPILHV